MTTLETRNIARNSTVNTAISCSINKKWMRFKINKCKCMKYLWIVVLSADAEYKCEWTCGRKSSIAGDSCKRKVTNYANWMGAVRHRWWLYWWEIMEDKRLLSVCLCVCMSARVSTNGPGSSHDLSFISLRSNKVRRVALPAKFNEIIDPHIGANPAALNSFVTIRLTVASDTSPINW